MNKTFCFTLLCAIIFSPSIASSVPITGDSEGIFVNSNGPVGKVVSGEGTSAISWGDPGSFGVGPSILSFSPLSYSAEFGEIFEYGVLSYFNGTIVPGTEITSVNLQITMNNDGPDFTNGTFNFFGELINTLNSSDPITSADIVFFPELAFLRPDRRARFHVQEGKSARATLIARFVSPSISDFSTIDNFDTQQTSGFEFLGFGRVLEGDGFLSSVEVPEPSTTWLLGFGFIGLIFARELSRRKQLSMSH